MYDVPYFNQAFSQVLRNQREQRRLTQMRLAVAIGGSEIAIRRMERGAQTPTLTTFLLLANALCLPPTEFLALIMERMNAMEYAGREETPKHGI